MAKQESDVSMRGRRPRQPAGNASAWILEDYLAELKAIHDMGGGVAETSYYPALSTLFNAVGKTLKPKVRCVMNLRNLGAGMPDGGLFTPTSSSAKPTARPRPGNFPPAGPSKPREPSPKCRRSPKAGRSRTT